MTCRCARVVAPAPAAAWLIAALCALCSAGAAWASAPADLAAVPPADVIADWKAQDGLARQAVAWKDALTRIAAELGPAGADLRGRAEKLDQLKLPAHDPQCEGLYLQACERRRRVRLAATLHKFKRVVFTKHYDLGGSHYAYTEGQSDAQAERHFVPGASLCLLEMDGLYAKVRTLLDDPGGVIRDPDVSYDAGRVLFAWKKSLDEDDYHLYEMNLADAKVRQLTAGLGFADYEGAYLPDGDIIFNSTRCVQTVDCWWTEVSTLFTCDADGRFLRRLSYDQVHTNFPTVTRDGRVIYTRWDYNDRGQIYPQGLFQMYPDGTGQTALYGNNSWFPTTILHARNIPGTPRIVCIVTGHHSLQKGSLGILNPDCGREENEGAQLIAPVRKTEAVHIDAYGQEGNQFQYPYPLGRTQFLVVFKPARSVRRFAIYWMDIDGRRELLASDAKISCSQPIPLVERPVPPVRPSMVDYRKDSGTFYVQDVYTGPGLALIPRGTIKSLRVVALEFRAAGIGCNTNSGPAGGALASTPVSVQGTWDVKVVLGTAKVHEDGSACFSVPANTPVYFQALDADNHAVQTMRSWAQLQPGETFSCAGCHESKNTAPPAGRLTQALREGPQALVPWYGRPRGFSFEREIQPILDRHCVRCHYVNDPTRLADLKGPIPLNDPRYVTAPAPAESEPKSPPPPGVKPAFSLRGAPGTWSPAYRALANRRVTDWINIQSAPPMLPPYHAGAAKSKLVAMLQKGHNNVKLSRDEMDRIACWIDLLVPCFGDYTEGLSPPERQKYNKYLAKRKRWEEQQRKNIQELLQAGGR